MQPITPPSKSASRKIREPGVPWKMPIPLSSTLTRYVVRDSSPSLTVMLVNTQPNGVETTFTRYLTQKPPIICTFFPAAYPDFSNCFKFYTRLPLPQYQTFSTRPFILSMESCPSIAHNPRARSILDARPSLRSCALKTQRASSLLFLLLKPPNQDHPVPTATTRC